MTNEDYHVSLEAKLTKLFKKYEKKLIHPEQCSIIKRGFVYSRVDLTVDVIVMGINPSQRTDFLDYSGVSYNYKDLESDRYFKKFHSLLEPYNASISYCDLFYHKHSDQKQLEHFMKDDVGKAFLTEQLEITRQILSDIKPKLILLFNRKAATFFTTDWLGFNVTKDLVLKNTEFTNNQNICVIPSLEAYIYFSTFLGYRTSKEAIRKVERDIPKLFDLL